MSTLGGIRVYVIGDIHGRLDLLDRAIASIRRDVRSFSGSSITVTLGDYIDRGPESSGVISRLAANPFPTHFVALRGNHEDMFEGFLLDPERFGPHWRAVGGDELLISYGITPPRLKIGRGNIKAASQLRQILPQSHIEFIRSLKNSFSVGSFFFCHAGIRPGIPINRQLRRDLLWIRRDFLSSTEKHEKIIVHGHTPVAEPEIHSNRINIDTEAYRSGRLTCLVLEDAGKRFLPV